MNIPTEHQVIRHNGQPVAVVVPYAEYVRTFGGQDVPDPTVPHDVVGRVVGDGASPCRAWREHLGLTQAEVASRMGITQSAYAQMEAPDARLRPATRRRIAAALGIAVEQLDL
ncbi:helix-turn-helix domain-containing protein [Nitratidesulfovibrio termitidis]|uniref:helix-turn-helix domain-containing protein n=1 Tax=Nitratidesulfovibrio termitidis TaxID=42252 RepID=UPI000416F43D|nr:helix-turn-helix transcriptional regulator [Nitratidesulfovibrio termitidis]